MHEWRPSTIDHQFGGNGSLLPSNSLNIVTIIQIYHFNNTTTDGPFAFIYLMTTTTIYDLNQRMKQNLPLEFDDGTIINGEQLFYSNTIGLEQTLIPLLHETWDLEDQLISEITSFLGPFLQDYQWVDALGEGTYGCVILERSPNESPMNSQILREIETIQRITKCKISFKRFTPWTALFGRIHCDCDFQHLLCLFSPSRSHPAAIFPEFVLSQFRYVSLFCLLLAKLMQVFNPFIKWLNYWNGPMTTIERCHLKFFPFICETLSKDTSYSKQLHRSGLMSPVYSWPFHRSP